MIVSEKIKNLFTLFFSMLKMGLFTFGGGYVTLTLLEGEYVEKRGWLTKEEFLDMISISESTPGPVAINGATYVGYKKAGIIGSILATIAVCIPSFVVIYLISLFFDQFLANTYVAYAFNGIRVCVVYLIFNAGMKLFKNLNKNLLSYSIVFITMIAMILISLLAINFSTVFIVLIFAVVGIILYLLNKIKGGNCE